MNTTTDGLSAQEAQKRLETYGENVLDEGKKKSLAVKFFEQFKDFMIIVLLAAAVISTVFSHDVVELDYHLSGCYLECHLWGHPRSQSGTSH